MANKLEDFIAKLPAEEQRRIAQRTTELLAEEASLRQLREARRQSQEELAAKLHVQQAAVSKIERRTDVYISTLRKYVEAMGGVLEITAKFPDQPPVKLTQFSE
ncbi:XRE family transcriptional regulator [Paludisphaera rhizosphaerae]|uniref:XRE family transcriptional regulator n=1 Tax=Paludisphaera rhizosphaerae TaxID=2711216 RepID=UPI0013EAEEBD|nr:XRE family transcriptional regulator [Paludisphaera rhizosphaerae]